MTKKEMNERELMIENKIKAIIKILDRENTVIIQRIIEGVNEEVKFKSFFKH
ncbi:hypothetical protein M2347_001407 [Chryseobacterium sp. H1D6B]|uniref:hypothetical protein n=1 Tax=Chryseobacterium sp. H1D6B TaxID=2940588 RepID=UPI0015CBBD1D|nr:hypothetical protein [Chryseobacterium sp. H1D6B]MDH6251680.1 hypothetical protein [Chryseobacterium sp. H1D6B]